MTFPHELQERKSDLTLIVKLNNYVCLSLLWLND